MAEDKAVVRRFYKAWEEEDQAKREKILDRILPPYYRYHDSEGGQRLDAEGIKRKVRESHDNFRQIQFNFEDQSAGEGEVSSRITMKAERRDGAEGEAGAGGEVPVEYVDICRIAGGMIEKQQWVRLPPAP